MVGRFFLETYGCQMNAADSAMVAQLLEESGYEAAALPEEADLILVNSCTVRDHAAERIHGRLTSLLAYRQQRPALLIGLLGCLAQHEGEEAWRRMPFLDLVVGPDGYRRLPALIAAAQRSKRVSLDVTLDPRETYADLPLAPVGDEKSAFVTVQRGCDRFCAYCIVPRVRGRERAVPAPAVLRQVRGLADQGCREVTLLGQTVNSYQHEGTDFAALLAQVAQIPGIARVRYLSPHPADYSPQLVQVHREQPTVMPHVHLPVQSGSDAVLQAMGRGHDRQAYLELVRRLRQAVPGIELTTDILVGFPGETEADLAETERLLTEVRFAAAYLYRYSERPGTRAAHKLPDTVPEDEKLRRLGRVIELQEEITREIFAGYCGREVEVLVEGFSRRDPTQVRGRSRESLPVVVQASPAPLPGSLVRARVTGSTGHTLLATS
ncbi:MAG: tRNA (N6-isopentenyl adenosine(37)-C2)-methylthiotransferase MiaB [Myxococcota bacterium]|jgi:tRNA-2-methylthio-N6-dimethylallyladenosine synthase|nr:tRNA (N6-isopentenyl adenosine(37)-C2)-methylthiotransferase MiaB [Myxococcota bacterium]